jgi:hypothetical protein
MITHVLSAIFIGMGIALLLPKSKKDAIIVPDETKSEIKRGVLKDEPEYDSEKRNNRSAVVCGGNVCGEQDTDRKSGEVEPETTEITETDKTKNEVKNEEN